MILQKNIHVDIDKGPRIIHRILRTTIDGEFIMAVKKSATKKPAAKKTATKKPVAKKTAAKKPVAKKTAAKKPAAKKAAAKKPAAKKPAAKKAPAKKAAAKKTTARKEVKSVSSEDFYKMIQEAAYFAAERDGFTAEPLYYWCVAEEEIRTRLGM